MSNSKQPVQIEDSILAQISNQLTELWNRYSRGELKYHSYAPAYDDVFKSFGVTKSDLIYSVENQLSGKVPLAVQTSHPPGKKAKYIY